MDSLKLLLAQNQRDRIAKELAAQNRISAPSLPRHTTYQGDRKIQQLGGEIIENGIVLNNQSLAIGDVVMPLAKGNVLRRVDNTNGGALLGTAYRDAVENDVDANGNRRDSVLSRNGGNEPSTPINPSPINLSTHPIFSPPFGCTPPPPKCFWTTNPTPPDGFQSHGSAVVNENAVPLYLHCTVGSAVPKNLNCSFLDPQKWSCSGGVCSPDANGIYNSQAECEAALVPAPFTGGQCRVTYRLIMRTVDGTGNVRFQVAGSQNANFTTLAQAEANLGTGTQLAGALGGDFRIEQPSFMLIWYISDDNATRQRTGSVGRIDFNVVSATVAGVYRVDGNPDNCGSLPPTCP